MWDERIRKYKPTLRQKRYKYNVWEEDFEWRYKKEKVFKIMKKYISKKNALDVFWEIKKKYFMTAFDGHLPQIALKVICEAYDISRSEVVKKSKVIKYINESGGYNLHDFVDVLISIKRTWQPKHKIESFLEAIDDLCSLSNYRRWTNKEIFKIEDFNKEGLETWSLYHRQWDFKNQNRDIFEKILFFYFWDNETGFHNLRFTLDESKGLMLLEWDEM